MYIIWAQNCVGRLVAYYVLWDDDIPVVGQPTVCQDWGEKI